MDTISGLLSSWNLAELVPVFEENLISLELLKELNPANPLEAFASLNLPIHQQVRFSSNWRKWIATLQTSPSTSTPSRCTTHQTPSTSTPSSYTTLLTPTTSTPSASDYVSSFLREQNPYPVAIDFQGFNSAYNTSPDPLYPQQSYQTQQFDLQTQSESLQQIQAELTTTSSPQVRSSSVQTSSASIFTEDFLKQALIARGREGQKLLDDGKQRYPEQ
uniref:Uncharacterized protein n=1 Tax=Cacopsylla melanoneura TaxID=428564 RepID=A0A8D9ERD9_9HEMI